MNIGELIARLIEQGVVSLHSTPEGVSLNDALDLLGVDPEAPVPYWNRHAQAWEV